MTSAESCVATVGGRAIMFDRLWYRACPVSLKFCFCREPFTEFQGISFRTTQKAVTLTSGLSTFDVFSHTAQEEQTLNEFCTGRSADELRDFRSVLENAPSILHPNHQRV